MPPNSEVWIVEGTAGQYSDKSEWVVAAFTDEARAKELADKANAYVPQIAAARSAWDYDYTKPEPKAVNPYDPGVSEWHAHDAHYSVGRIPLDPAIHAAAAPPSVDGEVAK